MIDAYTDTWRAIAQKANEIIDAGKDRLCENDQSYGQSQYYRGRISAMRELLDMVKPVVVKSAPPQELRPRDRSGI